MSIDNVMKNGHLLKDRPLKYALCYLHDWDMGDSGERSISPQIHGSYDTFQEAEAMRKEKQGPYWVVQYRDYTGLGF